MIRQAAVRREGFERASTSVSVSTHEHLDGACGLVTGALTGLMLWALGVAVVVSLRIF